MAERKCSACDHWSPRTSCCCHPARDKKLFVPEQCPHYRERGSALSEPGFPEIPTCRLAGRPTRKPRYRPALMNYQPRYRRGD